LLQIEQRFDLTDIEFLPYIIQKQYNHHSSNSSSSAASCSSVMKNLSCKMFYTYYTPSDDCMK